MDKNASPPSLRTLQPPELHRALQLRDLSDPDQGSHAIQQIYTDILHALESHWACRVLVHRGSALVNVVDNYDHLGYSQASVTRDARYTRYVTPNTLLRTHTSAMIPPLLRSLAVADIKDVLLACPGMVYRRDSIDKTHTGEPHQIDLWRLRAGGPALSVDELQTMVQRVVASALPGHAWRTVAALHPYTREGLQIDVQVGEDWLEIGECGLASPDVLAEAGLPGSVSGLAMGLGLDRLLMLRKGLSDIRLLRAIDPRIAAQMRDLAIYRPVSNQPRIRRDLSIAVHTVPSVEELGDRLRRRLGDDIQRIEELSVISTTPYEDLPGQAVERLGMGPRQTNLLVRLIICDIERTMTNEEANRLRDRVYAELHEGDVYDWACTKL